MVLSAQLICSLNSFALFYTSFIDIIQRIKGWLQFANHTQSHAFNKKWTKLQLGISHTKKWIHLL